MTGDRIPDRDHIARLCKPTTIENGIVTAAAFMLRQTDDYLSVNWLGCLNCTNRIDEIKRLIEIFKNKEYTVSKNAKLAVLNIGEMCNYVREESKDNRILDVIHRPDDNDFSHSGIFNLKQDNMLIAEIIVEIIQDEYYVNKIL